MNGDGEPEGNNRSSFQASSGAVVLALLALGEMHYSIDFRISIPQE